MKKDLEVCGISAEPGEVKFERIPLKAEMADGTPISIPLILVNGAEPGPTLYLQACIHGNEVTGMEVVRRATLAVNPHELSGNLITVPTANVPAYLTKTYCFALEERFPMNMYSLLPGRPDGFLTERIAYFLYNKIIHKSDYVMDMHSCSFGSCCYPFASLYDGIDTGLEERKGMARATGAELIQPWSVLRETTPTPPAKNRFMEELIASGRQIVGMEIGEGPSVTWEYVSTGVEYVKNVMMHLGMMKGKPKITQTQRMIKKIIVLRTNRGGILHVRTKLGQRVCEGETVAEVNNAFGRVEELLAPATGVVMRRMRMSITYPGAEAVWIAVV